jgi:hypothetical protein
MIRKVVISQGTRGISTNSNISFYGTYGCSNLSFSSRPWVLGKWISKNPNFKSNNDDDNNEDDDDDDNDDDDEDDNDNDDEDEDDEDNNDDVDDERLRRGCCVKKRTRHVTRVHLGGRMEFRAERKYLDPKKEHPTISMVIHHLVHLNSHLEIYKTKNI